MEKFTKPLALLLVFSLFGLIVACSGGSGSGGGSSVTGTPVVTVPTTYSNADLKGTWRWNANRQTAPLNLTGSLTFNGDVRVENWETDYCPGRQNFIYSQFWLWEDGYVKGRNPAFCDFPYSEVKFSMDFVPGSNKTRISGLMDIHQLDPTTGIDTYERFDITMIKQ